MSYEEQIWNNVSNLVYLFMIQAPIYVSKSLAFWGAYFTILKMS